MTFYPRSLALFWLALGRQLGRLGLYDESMNKRTTQTWGLNFYFSHLAMINYSEIQLRDDFASFSMLSSLCFFLLSVVHIWTCIDCARWWHCRHDADNSLSFFVIFFIVLRLQILRRRLWCGFVYLIRLVFDAQIKLSNSNIRLIAVGLEKRQKIMAVVRDVDEN